MKIVTRNGLIMRQGIREDYILEGDKPIFNYNLDSVDKISVIDTSLDNRIDFIGNELNEIKSLDRVVTEMTTNVFTADSVTKSWDFDQQKQFQYYGT